MNFRWTLAALIATLGLGLFVSQAAQARVFYLQAKGGLCIDVTKGKAAYGTPIILWHCHGKAPQQFVLDAGAGKVKYAANPNFCVDQKPGARVLELTECKYAANRWTYDPRSKRVSNPNGLCWDVPGGRYNPLQRMQVWQCHDGGPQKFAFN